MNRKTFTLEQIYEAHDKVKSGADFPGYISEIRTLGVTGFKTYVSDSHTEYRGEKGLKISSPAMYDKLTIANKPQKAQFKEVLRAHREGEIDYLTFCKRCAEYGIEKWIVSIDELTCIYYDTSWNQVWIEKIPR